MKIKNNIKSLLTPLKAVCELLESARVKSMIIGGISVSLLGKPRFTADIDAVAIIDFDDVHRGCRGMPFVIARRPKADVAIS